MVFSVLSVSGVVGVTIVVFSGVVFWEFVFDSCVWVWSSGVNGVLLSVLIWTLSGSEVVGVWISTGSDIGVWVSSFDTVFFIKTT